MPAAQFTFPPRATVSPTAWRLRQSPLAHAAYSRLSTRTLSRYFVDVAAEYTNILTM